MNQITRKNLIIIILTIPLAVSLACELPFSIPIGPREIPNPAEGNEINPPEPAQEQPDGDIQITFSSERPSVDRGSCTFLNWHVNGGRSARIEINPPDVNYDRGRQVDLSDRIEVCPLDNTVYTLFVETEGPPRIAETIVNVLNGGEPPPPPGAPPAAPPGAPPAAPPGAPPAAPPTAPPAAPPPPGPFTTDIAITDLYPGNQPTGMFQMRITNHGPRTLTNVQVSVSCSSERTNKVNGNLSSGGNNTFTVTLNANPGITQVFPTGLTLDLTTFNYLVGCQVKPGFNDPNPSNNTYNETFK